MEIEIPEDLTIERDREEESRLYEMSRKWIEGQSAKRSSGWHASDLLRPRFAYWKSKKTYRLTDREVTTFLVGHVLHAFIECGVRDEPLNWRIDEGGRYSKELGIAYSPDMRKPNGEPEEVKTARNRTPPPKSQEGLRKYFHHYLKQLLIYIVAEGNVVGHLKVLFLNAKKMVQKVQRTFPLYQCYKVSIPPERVEPVKKQLIQIRKRLDKAVKDETPEILPLCDAWMCGDGACPAWDDCKPEGRYGKRTWTA